jgi:MFS family permease
MPSPITRTRGLFTGLDLPADARRTFRLHLAYAVLDGAAGGILLLAPLIAWRMMRAESWHLPLREAYAGFGTLAALYLGCRMAPRRKMPFVFIPGLMAGICTAAMALAVGSAFWFLTLLGLGAMLEVVTRPAITAILRLNYPVSHRAAVTGRVRQWSSISFAVSIMLAALLLNGAGKGVHAQVVVQRLIALAALMGLTGLFCFRRIRADCDAAEPDRCLQPEILHNVRDAVGLVIRNARFRRCLVGCFMENFCGTLYLALIWAFLSSTLGFGYLGCAALMHALPAAVAFMSTGLVGRWIDRSSPWRCWAWIRFAWGADALMLAFSPLAAVVFAPMALVLPLLARLLRGSVQGGWWLLWWQIGVTHFAPPGEDTSRYTGMMVFTHGASRLLGSLAAMGLAAASAQPVDLLVIGGVGVVLSGVYSLLQAARDRRERQPQTIAEFEAQFASPTTD